MQVFVYRDGRLVRKRDLPVRPNPVASILPAPAVHSFESYASPIDDATISSHRQRDRDLASSGSYDPRDTPATFRRARDGRRKHAKRGPAEP
jgi:hypothetical protein